MYSYENGQKRNNIGHVKVETRGSQCKINVHMQSSAVNNKLLKAYMYYRDGKKFGCAYLGNILIKNNFGELKVKTSAGDVMNSNISIDSMEAVIVYQNYDIYFGAQIQDNTIISDEIIEFIEYPDSIFGLKSSDEVDHNKSKELLEASMLQKDITIESPEQEVSKTTESIDQIRKEVQLKNGTETPVEEIKEEEVVKIAKTEEKASLDKPKEDRLEDIIYISGTEPKRDMSDFLKVINKGFKKESNISSENHMVSSSQNIDDLYKAYTGAYEAPVTEQSIENEDATEYRYIWYEDETNKDSSEQSIVDNQLPEEVAEEIQAEALEEMPKETVSEIQEAVPEVLNEEIHEVEGMITEKGKDSSSDEKENLKEQGIFKDEFQESLIEQEIMEAEPQEKLVEQELVNELSQEDLVEQEILEAEQGNPVQAVQVDHNAEYEEKFKIENDATQEKTLSSSEASGQRNVFEIHPIAKKIFTTFPKIYPFEDTEITDCVRIEPQDIGLLPIDAWVLGSNSFLLHGYYSYQHLIFGKINRPSGYIYILGVPGIFHNRESFMARMFGFEHFKCTKRKEQKTGEFGYWYIPIILR